jgi:hypothetical protein
MTRAILPVRSAAKIVVPLPPRASRMMPFRRLQSRIKSAMRATGFTVLANRDVLAELSEGENFAGSVPAAASCWYKRAIAGQGEGMRIQRRTLLAAGLTGIAWTATQGLAAASNTRTRFVFHVSSTWGDLLDWLVDRGYHPITAELEKRGFPSMLVHSSVSTSAMRT